MTYGTQPIASPYGIDGRGRTAETTSGQHVLDLIEMLLFTAPGERVMRPTFGSGILGLVFDPNSNELAATTQFVVAGALQTWLGDLIQVGQVLVTNDDATLTVTVSYVDLATSTAKTAIFTTSSP